jgi:hypothetical protein
MLILMMQNGLIRSVLLIYQSGRMLDSLNLQHLLVNHRLYTCFYCSLRFRSEDAMEGHVLAKHARFRCEVCDSGFETEIGRNRHYRDSSAHPTCSKCGCSCDDHESLRKVYQRQTGVNVGRLLIIGPTVSELQHERDTHPQLACPPRSGQLVYVNGIDGHDLESPSYLTCSYCLVTFENRFSYKEVSSRCLSRMSTEPTPNHLTFTCQHIDSVHSGLQTCYLAKVGATPEYLYMGPSDYRGDSSNDMECDRGLGDMDEDVVRSTVHRNSVNFFKLSDSIDHLFAICFQVLSSGIDRRRYSGVIL